MILYTYLIIRLARMSLVNRIKIFTQILALCLIWFGAASYAGQFKVVRVTDGANIKVANNGTTPTIRLVGIDAPQKIQEKESTRSAIQPEIDKVFCWSGFK